MRESQFGQKIKKHLPKEIHWQSNTGALMANGTPDKYLDGARSDLWMELKQFDAMPRSGIVNVAPVPNVKKQPRGHLTALQEAWLKRRWLNAMNAIVVVGLPNGLGVIMEMPAEWERGVAVTCAITPKEIAAWISKFCLG